MSLKSYEGKIFTKKLLINNIKENYDIESIKEGSYDIIINLKNNDCYGLIYEPINDKIKILEVYEIHTALSAIDINNYKK